MTRMDLSVVGWPIIDCGFGDHYSVEDPYFWDGFCGSWESYQNMKTPGPSTPTKKNHHHTSVLQLAYYISAYNSPLFHPAFSQTWQSTPWSWVFELELSANKAALFCTCKCQATRRTLKVNGQRHLELPKKKKLHAKGSVNLDRQSEVQRASKDQSRSFPPEEDG